MTQYVKIYIVVSLVVIAILSYALIDKMRKEQFCNCTALGRKTCPNPQGLQQLYSDGQLTEYTDLAKEKPVWQKTPWMNPKN